MVSCAINFTMSVINSLKLLAFNVEGLKFKLEDPTFLDLIFDHDICFLSETWKANDCKLSIPGYWDYSQVRPKHKRAIRHSGGITIMVKDSIRPGIKVAQDTEGFIWLKMSKEFFCLVQDLYICAAYIPPKNTTTRT